MNHDTYNRTLVDVNNTYHDCGALCNNAEPNIWSRRPFLASLLCGQHAALDSFLWMLWRVWSIWEQLLSMGLWSGAMGVTWLWVFDLTVIWVQLAGYQVNPLRAIFFRENRNIYLYFMSFLHTNKTQVVEIPPRVRQGPDYYTKLISWLLMSWRRKEPGHQQPWHWPS